MSRESHERRYCVHVISFTMRCAGQRSVNSRAELSSSSLSFLFLYACSSSHQFNDHVSEPPTCTRPIRIALSVSGSDPPPVSDRSTVPYVFCVTVSHRYTVLCLRKARRAASPELARSPQWKRKSSRPVARRLAFRFVSCPPVASRVGNDRC